MTEAEQEFDEQLAVFSSECRDAVRYMSTLYAMYRLINEDRSKIAGLNRAPIVWNAILDALEQSVVLTVGRIFDPNPQNYSVSRLFGHAQRNVGIFAPNALRSRLCAEGYLSSAQIEARVLASTIPAASDFIEIRKSLAIHRRAYETDLRPSRHQFLPIESWLTTRSDERLMETRRWIVSWRR